MSNNRNANRKRNQQRGQRQRRVPTIAQIQEFRAEGFALGWAHDLDDGFGGALLYGMLEPTHLGHHHLTVTPGGTTCIDVEVDADHVLVDDPIVLGHLLRILYDGDDAGVVLRSVTSDTHHQLVDGDTIPISHVRGWKAEQGEMLPLNAAEIFSAMNTHHETGEPLAPEPGVEYLDAHDIWGDDDD